ncbi:hypothetical protein ALC57_03115, partial [Trachymyrmex cornetzi]
KYLNATPSRSTSRTPFQVTFGINARLKENLEIREMIENEWMQMFEEERDDIRQRTREKIAEVQKENLKSFNKKRKEAQKYVNGDIVAIKRTQFGPGLKFRNKFLGPYRVVRVMRNDRYTVEKIGEHEGPQETSTSADHMKPWLYADIDELESEEETEEDDSEKKRRRRDIDIVGEQQ